MEAVRETSLAFHEFIGNINKTGAEKKFLLKDQHSELIPTGGATTITRHQIYLNMISI